MVTTDRRDCRGRRPAAGRGAVVLIASLALGACSSMDPTGLLAEESAEPERVDAGQAADGEASYPELDEVPDEPERRPSSRESREAMADSLAADRENARYSEETLRSPEAAPDQDQSEPQRETAARETGESDDTAAGRSGPSDDAGMADDGGAMAGDGEASDGGGDPDARSAGTTGMAADDPDMPEVPDAPSETRADREQGQARATRKQEHRDRRRERERAREERRRRLEERRAERDARRAAEAARDRAASGDRMSGERTTGSAKTGERMQSREPAQTGERRRTAGRRAQQDRASGGGRQQSAAVSERQSVEVNRSQIPQMTPSRRGEPVKIPGEVRQRVGGAAASRDGANGARRTTRGQQTARSQPDARRRSGQQDAGPESPPADPEQVKPQAATDEPGTRVAVIYFPHGSAALDGEDRQVLQKVADLYENHDGRLRVVGHASSRTATMDMIDHRVANLDTSMRRAEKVADVLARLGVPRGEIKVVGRSDRDPAYHEFMPTGEAGNRRAEIFLSG